MIIDSHIHISLYENNAKNLKEACQLLVKEMKANSVDYAIVIPDNIEGDSHIADLETALKLTKESKKFFFLGSPQIIQRDSKEIEKYTDLLKNKTINGIKFFPGHDPYYPTDKRCEVYYDLCQKSKAPIVFHTGENSNNPKVSKYNDPKYIVEVANKYPKLKVIITHYFWPKIDYCYEITKNTQNIYFELAGVADEEVLEKSGGIKKMKEVLTKTVNDRPEKIIYGTDWPMCKMKNHVDLVKSLNISDSIKQDIFSSNAIKTYNLNIE